MKAQAERTFGYQLICALARVELANVSVLWQWLEGANIECTQRDNQTDRQTGKHSAAIQQQEAKLSTCKQTKRNIFNTAHVLH